MSDRAVSLDLRTLAGDAGSLPGQQQQSHRKPHDLDPSLAERFAAALALSPASEPQQDESLRQTPFALFRHMAPPPSEPPPLDAQPVHEGAQPGPAAVDTVPESDTDPLAPTGHLSVGQRSEPMGFAIPGQLPTQARALEPNEVQLPSSSSREQLLQSVAELAKRLLVSDGSAGRREVRIELSEGELSGVTVSVYQASGEWVAQFNCIESSAFSLLAESATPLAQELADTLRSPACWLVMMDPPDDHTVEARALPERTLPR